MATERRKDTEEFKREAVRLMASSGKPIAELARDLGINDNNLYRWRTLCPSAAREQAPSVSEICDDLV